MSSLQSLELNDNQILVIFETESGDVRSVRLDKDLQILADTEIAPFAQIGCAKTTSDGYRIGLIRRDPQTASYTLDIQSFDKTGTAKSSWKAVSRGFVPDPGSRCAFLDSRKLIVNGTRPRGDRPPYHGLFLLESSSLTQLDGPVSNEVELLSGSVANEGILLFTREIRRESDKPSWVQVLYKLNEDNTLSEVLSGDFVLPDRTIVEQNGCIHPDTVSSIPDIKVTEARRLSDRIIELKTRHTAHFAERTATGYREIHRSDEIDIYPVNANLWLAASPDANQPDIGTSLGIMLSGFECAE